MSVSSIQNSNLYLDQYFPTEAPEPAVEPSSEGGDYAEDLEPLDDVEVVDDASASEESEEIGFEEEEEVAEPSSRQKSTMEWLEDHGAELEGKYIDAQERLSDLLGGAEDLKPEERKLKLQEVESTLSEIERELGKYADKQEWLQESELPEELWDFDSNIDPESMEEELELIRKDLGEAVDSAETEASEAAEAEAKAETEEKEGRQLKDQLSDLLGYLNGSKDKVYFTAKVWGDKHIKDYHEDVTQYALAIVSGMSDAAVSGDWDAVSNLVTGLDSGAADNTLGLVGFLLNKFCPQALEKMPSEVLESMSDAILRGNAPGDSRIYFINQDGKYDGPKDDRRRKDMGHEGFRYQDAADIFQNHAETNRAREKAEAEEAGEDGDASQADGEGVED